MIALSKHRGSCHLFTFFFYSAYYSHLSFPFRSIYRGVQNFLMPMFWFEQYAVLDKTLTAETKVNDGDQKFFQTAGI